jgi:hypothetical protein
MVNPDLVAYIKQVLEKGYKKEQIEDHLVKHGHTKEDVKEAFSALDYQELGNLQKEIPPKKKTHPQVLYIILGVVFVGLLLVGIFFLSQKLDFSLSNNCQDISLTLYELQEQPVLCVYDDNSKIQMIVENNGIENIGKLDIVVKGSRKTVKDSLDNLNILSKENAVEQGDHLFTRVVEYGSENGEVKSVEIIPYSLYEGKYAKCTDKKIIATEINTC